MVIFPVRYVKLPEGNGDTMLYGAPNYPMYWEFFGILRIQSGNPDEPSGENVEVSVMSCSVVGVYVYQQ